MSRSAKHDKALNSVYDVLGIVKRLKQMLEADKVDADYMLDLVRELKDHAEDVRKKSVSLYNEIG